MNQHLRKGQNIGKYIKGIILLMTILMSCINVSPKKKDVNIFKSGPDELMDSIIWESGDQKGVIKFKDGKVSKFLIFNKTINDLDEINFWPNNRVKSIKRFKDGLKYGRSYSFEDDQALNRYETHIKIGDTTVLNEHQFFFEGNIINESSSNYFSVYYDSDSVPVGSHFNFRIKKHGSILKDKLRLILGDFDEDFQIPDQTRQDTIECSNNECSVSFLVKKKNNTVIRGILQEYSILQKKDTIQVRKMNSYFSIPIICY